MATTSARRATTIGAIMLIFTDFDGVAHPKLIGAQVFSRTSSLWKILRSCPEVRVVFSTSWREAYQFEELQNFVTYGGGEDLIARFIGCTPIIKSRSDYDRRDLEIQSWLDANGHTGHWLALDDQAELFQGGGEHPNLYLVDGTTGLTDADVDAIIQRIQTF